MKLPYSLLALPALLILSGCPGKKGADPEPEYTVEVRYDAQNPAGIAAVAGVADNHYLTPGARFYGTLQDITCNCAGNTVQGTFQKGTVLHLFTVLPRYTQSSTPKISGQGYLKVELLVNGQPRGTILLNAASANDPSKQYTPPGATYADVVEDVAVTL
jgi:hypothetical protein